MPRRLRPPHPHRRRRTAAAPDYRQSALRWPQPSSNQILPGIRAAQQSLFARQAGVCHRETGARCLNFALSSRRSRLHDASEYPRAPPTDARFRVNDTTRPPIAADTTCAPADHLDVAGSSAFLPLPRSAEQSGCLPTRFGPARALSCPRRGKHLPAAGWRGRLIVGLAAATTTGEKKGQGQWH
jgi:hypothetical protein